MRRNNLLAVLFATFFVGSLPSLSAQDAPKQDPIIVKMPYKAGENANRPTAEPDFSKIIIVLDGKRMEYGKKTLEYLDPNSIQSVDVIKDKTKILTMFPDAQGVEGVIVVVSKK
jgi:hypothetical protein